MGIIAAVIAFAAGCAVSIKFWFGVVLGCFVPAVRRGLVRGWTFVRGKIGI